jgi:uncharacterized protein (TIGR01777 family)
MRIVIAGGTGFLGSPLAEVYAEEGHDVRVLTRSLAPGESRHDSGTGVPGVTRVGWRPEFVAPPGDGPPQDPGAHLSQVIENADAVINLAGESIADGRWTPQRKARLRDSRIVATRALAAAIAGAKTPPRVFVSGSGVNYYGARGDEPLTEEAAPGDDFLAHLCVDWEREAQRASAPATRVAVLRAGLVLERSGGALPKMLTAFKLFAGGPIASGRQYMSWIHRLDWVEMVRWIVETPDVSGPFNATAPHPVTNRHFARALGRSLRRPALVPAPAFALKIALGEMAQLLITGQRVIPARAKTLGFHFRYPEIEQAFRGIFED